MADLRVSQLNEATSVDLTDLFYLSANGTDRKLTVKTLLNKGVIANNAAYQTITGQDNVSLSTPITLITASSANFTLTIGTGVEGQEKLILLKSTTGGTVTISGFFAGYTTINLTRAGDSVKLVYITNQWFIQGGINHPVV